MLLLIAVHVIVVIIITTTIITTTTTTCSVVILLLNSDALTAGSCNKSHAAPGGGGGGGGGGGVMGMLNLKRRDCKGADSTAGVLGGVLDTVPGPSAGSSCPQATSPPRCSSWTPATNVTAVHDSRVWGLGLRARETMLVLLGLTLSVCSWVMWAYLSSPLQRVRQAKQKPQAIGSKP